MKLLENTKIIALIDLDFGWTNKEVEKILQASKRKMHIKQMAKIVRRPIDEVAVLLIHLGREGKI